MFSTSRFKISSAIVGSLTEMEGDRRCRLWKEVVSRWLWKNEQRIKSEERPLRTIRNSESLLWKYSSSNHSTGTISLLGMFLISTLQAFGDCACLRKCLAIGTPYQRKWFFAWFVVLPRRSLLFRKIGDVKCLFDKLVINDRLQMATTPRCELRERHATGAIITRHNKDTIN